MNAVLEGIQLWERQPTDTEKSYSAFEVFRSLGHGRRLQDVATMLGCTHSNINRWSLKHHWTERVAAYDRWEARLINTQVAMGQAEMRVRQAGLARELLDKAKERLATMSQAEVQRMSPGEVALFAKAGADIEREAREIPADEMGSEGYENIGLPGVILIERREDQVAVRLPSGRCGWIDKDKIEKVQERFADAVIFA